VHVPSGTSGARGAVGDPVTTWLSVAPAVLALVMLAHCSGWMRTGRLVDGRCIHVGLRPASDAIGEWAVTVQVAADWNPCPRERQ
jgi:hypothetical protein